jgi:hypothetical protein
MRVTDEIDALLVEDADVPHHRRRIVLRPVHPVQYFGRRDEIALTELELQLIVDMVVRNP